MIRASTSRAGMALISVALILAASVADARGMRGGSFGSRGARTWSTPPATQTAPKPATPIQRSVTPQSTQPGTVARTNTGVNPAAPRGGIFNRPGFLGGLLGAGLIGMLLGGGFFGGLAGLGSFLGLLLQLALVFFLVRWAFNAFARRQQPALAGASAPAASSTSPSRFDFPQGFGSTSTRRSPAPVFTDEPLSVDQRDLDHFEQMLAGVQTAYGREDLVTLGRLATPEMASYFAEELADNASRGLVNRVSDIRLLQGDIAESWREGPTEYATAAMRYSLHDVTEERDTGRVVETGPNEVTELWTFRRAPGGSWLLSAIQQA